MNSTMIPSQWHASNLTRSGVCSHSFFGRRGGVCSDSKGRQDDFNIGFLHAEDTAEPLRHRQSAMEFLAPSEPTLVTPRQTHSSIVHLVTEPWDNLAAPEGDAVVTSIENLAMGILTADCGPLLFADPINRVVAAAHAGWRGAVDGIPARTVEGMEKLGAKRSSIHVALGPCIAQPSYEVGPDFPSLFIDRNAGHKSLFVQSPKPGHWMFDLKGFIASELKELGLASIEILPEDTCADDKSFFSHRYNTLNKLPEFGRQLSVICLTPL
jgi:YfiH family protein